MTFLCDSFRILLILLLVNQLAGCKSFVQVGVPANQLSSSNVFEDDATAGSAISGIYSSLSSNSTLTGELALCSGLCADELTLNVLTDNSRNEFFNNSLTAGNYSISDFWGSYYTLIYNVNSLLEGLDNSDGISIKLKTQLKGEAKFIRAFLHFQLVNMFGDVPYISTTDYEQNTNVKRMPMAEVYKHVVDDLNEAITLLASGYPANGSIDAERGRPNKSAAISLLARVCLYAKDWQGAITSSTKVIDNDLYQLQDDLNKIFLKDSPETIWQLFPVIPGYNTWEGLLFIPTSIAAIPGFSLSAGLIKGFEDQDKRRTFWIDSLKVADSMYYYPYKYKIQMNNTVSECAVVFRLAEQILIRAEARMNSGDMKGARDDLNRIRERAGLKDVNTEDKDSLSLMIFNERRLEFFAEMGHRWMDLKRTNRADSILAKIKGANWQTTDQLFPIPQSQIERAPNMHSAQNPGY